MQFEVSTKYSPWVINCKILSIYSVAAYSSLLLIVSRSPDPLPASIAQEAGRGSGSFPR